jgi:predicted RNA-binding Zn-ribbon protein involved in translation (DUF1610 family)
MRMFYVKTQLAENTEIRIDIGEDNVFTMCPGCGEEHAIDIQTMFSTGETDLYGTSVYCPECSKKKAMVK